MLKESEWITVNNILLELYTVRHIDVLAAKIMKIIRMMIPYTKGWFLVLDGEEKIDREKSYFTGFDDLARENYIKTYYEKDYLGYLYEITPETSVYRDTDILDEEMRRETCFYRDYLKPQEVIYGCGVMMVRDTKITALFNLFRDKNMGDFTDRELYILNLLKKHLENMVCSIAPKREGENEDAGEKNIRRFCETYRLTEREEEVLSLLNKGYSNQEIASELVISLSTVKKHMYHIFQKTEVSGRVQLLALLSA